jgi:uncharacterized membrane protein YsdA (DUF1294 family)
MSKGWEEALWTIGCAVGCAITGYIIYRHKKRKGQSGGVYSVVVVIVWTLIYCALKLIFRF